MHAVEQTRWAVAEFAAVRGRLPHSIDEICTVRSLCDMLQPRVAVDPWGAPLQYTADGDDYVLRSLGPDGVPHTADDLVFSSAEERARVAALSGCYRFDPPGGFAGETIHLDDAPQGRSAYQVRSSAGWQNPAWRPTGADSLQITWVRGVALDRMELRREGDRLVGRWRRGGEYRAGRWHVVSATRCR